MAYKIQRTILVCGLLSLAWGAPVQAHATAYSKGKNTVPGLKATPSTFIYPLNDGETRVSLRLALPQAYVPSQSVETYERTGFLEFYPPKNPAVPGREVVTLSRDFAGPQAPSLISGFLDGVEEGLKSIGARILDRKTEQFGTHAKTSMMATYAQGAQEMAIYMVYYGGKSGLVLGLQCARPVMPGETVQEVVSSIRQMVDGSFGVGR